MTHPHLEGRLRDAVRCLLDIGARRTLLPSEVTHWEALLAEPALAALPGGGVDGVSALDAVYADFCAKDNGDVPLERYPQGAVDALARAGWAVVPCALPFAVLGDAAIAGVFETGNPKRGWDYLIARTRIGPNAALQAATGGASE